MNLTRITESSYVLFCYRYYAHPWLDVPQLFITTMMSSADDLLYRLNLVLRRLLATVSKSLFLGSFNVLNKLLRMIALFFFFAFFTAFSPPGSTHCYVTATGTFYDAATGTTQACLVSVGKFQKTVIKSWWACVKPQSVLLPCQIVYGLKLIPRYTLLVNGSLVCVVFILISCKRNNWQFRNFPLMLYTQRHTTRFPIIGIVGNDFEFLM